jgi:membrane-bound lytic murein transglycosylase D
MNLKFIIQFIACSLIFISSVNATGHDVTFCGEKIPVADRFVADKLMGIIKKQMNYSIVSQLRQKENEYMKTIEYYLMKTGLPEDIKYLAIVESGLRNVVSPVGAAGFWQIMKPTAGDLNLIVNGEVDERNDINKSTYAACKLLASYYIKIRKDFRISSWVLTTAAYNNGIGNISKAIKKQGKNYFVMNLNKETAEYVYKVIALKELLEFPELYMQGFGYNIFTTTKEDETANTSSKKEIENLNLGGNITVKVDKEDGAHPEKLDKKITEIKDVNAGKEKFISAFITGKYKNFKDGNIISFTLNEDLQVSNRFTSKGMVIQGRGWIIDGRVVVDLGYDHYVVLTDNNKQKGIDLNSLKNKEDVLLKVTK